MKILLVLPRWLADKLRRATEDPDLEALRVSVAHLRLIDRYTDILYPNVVTIRN